MVNSGVEWLPQVISYAAGEDLTGAENLFVKLNANGDVVKCTALTDRAIGVLRDGNPAGGTVGVWQGFGIVPVKVTATGIAPGDFIGVTTAAKGKKLAAGTDTTQYIHGVAQESSTGADELISVAIVIPTAKAA